MPRYDDQGDPTVGNGRVHKAPSHRLATRTLYQRNEGYASTNRIEYCIQRARKLLKVVDVEVSNAKEHRKSSLGVDQPRTATLIKF